MDWKKLEERLAELDGHIAVGEERIARQQKIIQDLKDAGSDTALAKHRLNNILQTQMAHVEERDRIVKQLTGGHHET